MVPETLQQRVEYNGKTYISNIQNCEVTWETAYLPKNAFGVVQMMFEYEHYDDRNMALKLVELMAPFCEFKSTHKVQVLADQLRLGCVLSAEQLTLLDTQISDLQSQTLQTLSQSLVCFWRKICYMTRQITEHVLDKDFNLRSSIQQLQIKVVNPAISKLGQSATLCSFRFTVLRALTIVFEKIEAALAKLPAGKDITTSLVTRIVPELQLLCKLAFQANEGISSLSTIPLSPFSHFPVHLSPLYYSNT